MVRGHMATLIIFVCCGIARYWIPLTIFSGKAFYGAIFPSWEWGPAQSAEGQSKVQQYSFAEPKGKPTVMHSPSKSLNRGFRLGFAGGIVQMPEGYAPTEQIMGSGMTVYYSVDSLDMVSLGAQILQEIRTFSRRFAG